VNYNLASPFYESARLRPERPAIHAYGKEWLYREVLERVASVSGWLRKQKKLPKRVGILASRSSDACIGILSAAWIGSTYVPVNLALPEAGLLDILKRSQLDILIADKEGSRLLTPALLDVCPQAILAYREYASSAPPERITDYSDLEPAQDIDAPVPMESGAPGYILYTSGSTGVPKGVIVPVGAVDHLLRALDEKYGLLEDDRVAETAATSFDISVYNMFATWRAGAALHILPAKQMMLPSRFIRDHQLTVWFSVPSVATLMSRMKLLKPGDFPSLRQTLFCGEPLLGSVAAEWQKAAPSSTVVNMYGPTEATVMCMDEDFGPSCTMTREIVAIGRPFSGMKAAVASSESRWAEDNVPGELLLSGPQLATGYLDDPEKTRSKFASIDGDRWYRTGDLAYRDSNGTFHYLGRIDNQVKVLGYRVELEEIEWHLRVVTGCEAVAAIAWPVQDGAASGIVGFAAGFEGSPAQTREAMKLRLPSYMVPRSIFSLPRLLRNSNGKVDRRALAEFAASQSHDAASPVSVVKPPVLNATERVSSLPSTDKPNFRN
jgi:amino acid adenylation domain-containing protein